MMTLVTAAGLEIVITWSFDIDDLCSCAGGHRPHDAAASPALSPVATTAHDRRFFQAGRTRERFRRLISTGGEGAPRKTSGGTAGRRGGSAAMFRDHMNPSQCPDEPRRR